MLLVAVLAPVLVFSICYRTWAYHGWVEYKLSCITPNNNMYEISGPASPELQFYIEKYFDYKPINWTDGVPPFYRDGERFFMRPWMYYGRLKSRIYATGPITQRVIGNKWGEFYCRNIYHHPKLYLGGKHSGTTLEYINFQDFAFFLSIIAPTPKRNP